MQQGALAAPQAHPQPLQPQLLHSAPPPAAQQQQQLQGQGRAAAQELTEQVGAHLAVLLHACCMCGVWGMGVGEDIVGCLGRLGE